jgi:hypothetical protein
MLVIPEKVRCYYGVGDAPQEVRNILEDFSEEDNYVILSTDDEGRLLDISINGQGVGYNTLRAVADAYKTEVCPVAYIGEYTLDAVRQIANNVGDIKVMPLTPLHLEEPVL